MCPTQVGRLFEGKQGKCEYPHEESAPRGDSSPKRHFLGIQVLGDDIMTLRTPGPRMAAVGCAAILVLSLVGCADSSGVKGGPATASDPSRPLLSGASDLTALVGTVQRAQDEDPLSRSARVAAGARPTVVESGGARQTMVIHDEDEARWQAGSYRLVVRCAGAGRLVAFIGIGGNARIKELAPCTPTVSVDYVNIAVPRTAAKGEVVITPVGDTRAAVVYQILPM